MVRKFSKLVHDTFYQNDLDDPHGSSDSYQKQIERSDGGPSYANEHRGTAFDPHKTMVGAATTPPSGPKRTAPTKPSKPSQEKVMRAIKNHVKKHKKKK